MPQPVSAKLPPRELAEIVGLAGSKVVVGAEPGSLEGADCLPVGYQPPPDLARRPAARRRVAGVEGTDVRRVDGPAQADRRRRPGARSTPTRRRRSACRSDGCLVMPGPLYHNGPAVWSCQALLSGSHVVLLERFDAEATLAAIEAYRADNVYLVPTMMKRIWRLPEDVRLGYDLSSLRVVWHLAEPCPMWLKEAWIDWLGAERIFELYAGTEAQAVTIITGPEWLEHRGSVGRPSVGEFMVTDPDGNAAAPG